MTIRDLQALLADFSPDTPLKIEFRYKTGYDEGDIYHLTELPSAVRVGNEVCLLRGGWTLVGGW